MMEQSQNDLRTTLTARLSNHVADLLQRYDKLIQNRLDDFDIRLGTKAKLADSAHAHSAQDFIENAGGENEQTIEPDATDAASMSVIREIRSKATSWEQSFSATSSAVL